MASEIVPFPPSFEPWQRGSGDREIAVMMSGGGTIYNDDNQGEN